MAQTAERRVRRPKRAGAYACLVVVCGALALGAAWSAAHPAGAISARRQGDGALVLGHGADHEGARR